LHGIWYKNRDFGLEFSRASGGVLNVVTKSGANSLHGALLEEGIGEWRILILAGRASCGGTSAEDCRKPN